MGSKTHAHAHTHRLNRSEGAAHHMAPLVTRNSTPARATCQKTNSLMCPITCQSNTYGPANQMSDGGAAQTNERRITAGRDGGIH